MAQNVGYLTSSSTKDSDEVYTPYYAVKPILKYLKPNSTIWCPFDKKWSAFVNVLEDAGHNVIYTHIDQGENFFFTKRECDYIISNPPFSLKDEVLAKLYELGKPFMMLLPLPSLQSLTRYEMFNDNGLELLVFNDRIGYHNIHNMEKSMKGNSFASIYFCWNILPKKLIFEKLIYEDVALLYEDDGTTKKAIQGELDI
jgi:hypothetical protein